MSILLMVLVFLGQSAPADEAILAGADARIAKYRTSEIELRLLDADGRPLPAGPRAQIEQTRHAFLFGCNIFMLGRYQTPEENAAYARYFGELLNYATLPFYWWGYEPKQGQTDAPHIRQVVTWCQEHHVTPKGHPLAWNWMDPAWLPDDPEQVMKLQVARIEQCVGEFRGQIQYWDVVNEATEADRRETHQQARKLTEAIHRVGVPGYLKACFQAARKANPTATLIINDYVIRPDYAEKVIKVLVDDAGRPMYDLIGIQCHQHGGAWSAGKTWEICERFAAFGKPLHFTEATILSGRLAGRRTGPAATQPWVSTRSGEQRQAREVVRFYTVLFSHPAVQAITWWDFADKGAWQGAPAGFLRQDLTPKPAYDALKGLIRGKWWTRTDAPVASGGAARFRGFFGEYRVTAELDGRRVAGTFWFDRDTHGPVEVRLR